MKPPEGWEEVAVPEGWEEAGDMPEAEPQTPGQYRDALIDASDAPWALKALEKYGAPLSRGMGQGALGGPLLNLGESAVEAAFDDREAPYLERLERLLRSKQQMDRQLAEQAPGMTALGNVAGAVAVPSAAEVGAAKLIKSGGIAGGLGKAAVRAGLQGAEAGIMGAAVKEGSPGFDARSAITGAAASGALQGLGALVSHGGEIARNAKMAMGSRALGVRPSDVRALGGPADVERLEDAVEHAYRQGIITRTGRLSGMTKAAEGARQGYGEEIGSIIDDIDARITASAEANPKNGWINYDYPIDVDELERSIRGRKGIADAMVGLDPASKQQAPKVQGLLDELDRRKAATTTTQYREIPGTGGPVLTEPHMAPVGMEKIQPDATMTRHAGETLVGPTLGVGESIKPISLPEGLGTAETVAETVMLPPQSYRQTGGKAEPGFAMLGEDMPVDKISRTERRAMKLRELMDYKAVVEKNAHFERQTPGGADTIVREGVYPAVRDALEAGVEKHSSPEEMARYLELKRNFGALTDLKEIVERSETAGMTRPVLPLRGAIMATSELAAGNPGGALGAAGVAAAANTVNLWGAGGRFSNWVEGVYQKAQNNPKLMPSARALAAAARRGSTSLIATDYILQQTDPEYRLARSAGDEAE